MNIPARENVQQHRHQHAHHQPAIASQFRSPDRIVAAVIGVIAVVLAAGAAFYFMNQ
jgi:hypothetical protein